MPRTRLKDSVDSFVNQNRPGENFGKSAILRLDRTTDNQKRSFIFFAGGPRPGMYVTEATLTLFARQDWAGNQDVTVQRIVDPWKERVITWRDQPDSTSDNETVLSVGPLDPHEQVDFDVTLIVRDAFLASGLPYYGFRLTGEDNGEYGFYSSEGDDPQYRPRLDVTWSQQIGAPYDLVPADGDVVSSAAPALRWSYFDPQGDEQMAFEVEVDTDVDFSSPSTSGEVTSLDPQYDWTFGAIPDDATRFWHVRVQDEAGNWSPWSDTIEFSRVTQGTLAILAPTVEIEETTPTIVTRLTGRDQRALAYLLEEQIHGGVAEGGGDGLGYGENDWGADPWGDVEVTFIESTEDLQPPVATLWSKARFPAHTDDGDDYEFEIPKKIIRRKAATYVLRVRSWDTEQDRVSTPGDPNYLEEEVVFSWVDPAAAPSSPTNFSANPEEEGGPGVVLRWSRASVPDYWALMVDDVIVEDKVDGVEWQLAPGTSYGITYYGSQPGEQHTYEVIARVTSGGHTKTSKNNPTDDTAAEPVGIWFIMGEFTTANSEARRIRLGGKDAPPTEIGESAEILYPVGRRDPIAIYDGIRGYEGTVSGWVMSADDLHVLEAIKSQPAKVVRLVMGDLNIPVQFGQMNVDRYPTEMGLYPVTVDVRQVDEFKIRARLR